MSQTDDVNPYAPSSHAADPALAELAAVGGRVSSTSLCLWTMAACTVAGGLFGLATLIFLVGSSLIFDTDRANMAPLVDIMMFAGYGIVVGGFLAFVSSVPSVMLVFLGGMPWRSADHRWDSKAIGRFAAVSGLLAGFLPLPAASGMDPSAVMFAVLPAIFGCFAARLLIIPLARKARERPEPLSSQLPGNYPGV
jgi:hypothetical protein